jgi:hypothetical protein
MAGAFARLAYALRLKRRPAVRRTRGDVLRSVPVRNSLVEWTKEESGEISLVIPVDQKAHVRLLIRLMKLPNKRVVSLDEVGSYVWECCDGQRTFEQITTELANRFRLTRREAEASLAEFLRVLGRRGMLGFVVPETASAKDGAARPSNSRNERSTPKRPASKRRTEKGT